MLGARADGGILIEWQGSGGAIEVHVEPDGRLGYLIEAPGRAGSTYDEADGVTLPEVIDALRRVVGSAPAV